MRTGWPSSAGSTLNPRKPATAETATEMIARLREIVQALDGLTALEDPVGAAPVVDNGLRETGQRGWYERVGDHAQNIAEDAVYAAAAEDIRHQTVAASA